MDRVGADFDRAVDQMKTRLGAKAIPIQIPIGAEDTFVGAIDLVTEEALVYGEDALGARYKKGPVPENLKAQVAAAREKVLEAVAEEDDAVMTRYLDGGKIETKEIRALL